MQGFKLKMDEVGNILIKRVSKSGVRVKNTTEESAVSNDILKLPGGLLEADKPFKVRRFVRSQSKRTRTNSNMPSINHEIGSPRRLRVIGFLFLLLRQIFDMKKFQQNMNRELKRPYPDRRKLESQCLSVVAFGAAIAANDSDILDCPIWILCVNIVAIEMLKTKLPPRKTTANLSCHNFVFMIL